MNKTLLTSALVSLVVAFGVCVAYPTKVQTVVQQAQENVGAVVSPIINSNLFSFGGVMEHQYRVKMNRASTTLCAIKSPSATSTLVSANWQITVGTSTAANIDLAKGNTANATTTLLVTGTSVGSGATGQAAWTTAGATAADDIMAPNTYVLVKTATAGLGGYTYTGTCSARFQEF